MKMLLVKKGHYLYPAYQSDQELYKSIKDGEMIQAEIKDNRNLLFHKKFYALLNCTIYHAPEQFGLTSVDILLNRLKILTGHYEMRIMEGKEIYVPLSISFQSMGQKKFEEFYSACFDAICERYLVGISEEEFDRDILNFM